MVETHHYGSFMGYVGRVLVPGERLRYATKIHWSIFLPGLILLVPALAALLIPWKAGTTSTFWMAAAIVLFGMAAFLLFGEWFRRWSTEIAVTSKRIIYKCGFVRRRTIEMNLDKVESVDVNQSILGRLLGYGDIVIRGVGVGIEPLRRIDHPITFRTHVTAD
jgi:uncharacterized membrane protein YdbT with pleckstrin-like domain